MGRGSGTPICVLASKHESKYASESDDVFHRLSLRKVDQGLKKSSTIPSTAGLISSGTGILCFCIDLYAQYVAMKGSPQSSRSRASFSS